MNELIGFNDIGANFNDTQCYSFKTLECKAYLSDYKCFQLEDYAQNVGKSCV